MTRIAIAAIVALLLGAATSAAQERGTRPSAGAAASAAVNLNTATAAQLEELPGIGKATAVRIIEYRQKIGGFKKIEELMNVQGIGEKSFLRLKPMITISVPRTDRASQQ